MLGFGGGDSAASRSETPASTPLMKRGGEGVLVDAARRFSNLKVDPEKRFGAAAEQPLAPLGRADTLFT